MPLAKVFVKSTLACATKLALHSDLINPFAKHWHRIPFAIVIRNRALAMAEQRFANVLCAAGGAKSVCGTMPPTVRDLARVRDANVGKKTSESPACRVGFAPEQWPGDPLWQIRQQVRRQRHAAQARFRL